MSPLRARHNSASTHGRPNVRAAGRLAPPPGLSFSNTTSTDRGYRNEDHQACSGERLVTNQLNRKGVLPQNIVDAARDIVANVRANGDAAVRDYCQRFDGVELQSFRLPQEQIDAALEGLDPAFVAALEKAARQIREFHQREVEQSWFTTRPDGTMLGVKVTPLAAAGIYVPGGRAQYPSTVLMNAIPAKVAGVERVVMVTPPQKDG